MEEKYKTISVQSRSGISSQVEIAELVLLNSSRYVRIGITPPTGEDPVIISLYANSDECNEPGEIGCNYLDEEYEIKEDVRWRNFKTFQDGEDEQVVRELPLPSNRETESGVMTSNTAAANITSMESIPVSSPPPRLGLYNIYFLFICLYFLFICLSFTCKIVIFRGPGLECYKYRLLCIII